MGKLQDALALDKLTGYSRIMIPFFAKQKYAKLTSLTKSANAVSLLGPGHQGHTIFSWSPNPPEVVSAFEANVPSPAEKLTAMQECAKAGYPVRAVIMPIIPVDTWQEIYASFLIKLLKSLRLERISLGQMCPYSVALRLAERKLPDFIAFYGSHLVHKLQMFGCSATRLADAVVQFAYTIYLLAVSESLRIINHEKTIGLFCK